MESVNKRDSFAEVKAEAERLTLLRKADLIARKKAEAERSARVDATPEAELVEEAPKSKK